MKPRVKVKVQFGGASRPAPPEPELVPRVARLLALAHYLDEQVRSGEIEDLAAAARELGLTRARVTQIMNVALLAPAIQESILASPAGATGRDPVTERTLRPIVAEPVWERQVQLWASLRKAAEAYCGLSS